MALRTVRLFISSPGDVAEERLIARRMIGRLDAQFGGHLQFEAVLWERVALEATASFQEQLVKPSDTDILVLILWSRMGTPLPSHITRADGSTYASGTEFEFEDAVEGYRRRGTPRVLAYLKTAPITPPSDVEALEEAARQKRAMQGFVARWFRNEADGTLKGAFHNFATPADFEDLLEAHLTQLAEQYMPPGALIRGAAPSWRGRSPFRGLQTFEPEHAPVFFGRTAATASVLAKLRAQGQAQRAFVLIVSMSGGGKSSLVRAGVLPLLLQPGVVGNATLWRQAVMRPSDGQGRLVDALVRAIAHASRIADDHDDDAEPINLQASPPRVVTQLVERLRRIASQTESEGDETPACHLALVIDQLEEAFSDERVTVAERDAFFALLDGLARSGSVWIIATMRSDAYPRIADAPTLVALKEGEGQYDLLPPSVREIGQIIRLPASAAGLRFETRPNTAEKLDDVIRDAAANNPGALPLLQFLLEELYQRRNAEDVLTFRAYEELGGVEGALAQHAETVLASVSPAARHALPAVLRELVTFGVDDESRALRRVAPRSAFASRAASELVDALLEARLLVSALSSDGTSVVSLAHEALLEFWPRMKAWVEEDRELLLVHARLAAATREWERSSRSPDLLLARGKPLAEAKELVAAGLRLSPAEGALLQASQRRAQQFAIVRASAIAGLAVLTLVAGIAAYRARVESARAQVQATTAQRTTDFMVGLFANADPDQSQGEKVTVREVLDRGVTQIESELRGEDEVRANLTRAMGQAYNGLGLYPKARGLLENAVKQSERSAAPDALLKARLALADNRYQDGDYDNSEALYRAALDQAARLHGMESDAYARANTGLAETLAEGTKQEEAESRYRAALALNLRLHGEDFVETARDLDGLARLLVVEGRYEEAEPLYLRSLQTQQSLFGAHNGNVASSLNNLGSLYFQLGQYGKAVDAWTRALPIYREVFGPEHLRVAAALNNLGRVELLTNRLEPARQHAAEALDIVRRSLNDSHETLILPLNTLAMVLIEQGDLPGAHRLLDDALRIARTRRHWMLNQVLGNEAELALREYRLDDARALLDEARATQRKLYGDKLDGGESWRSAVLDLTDARLELAAGRRIDAQRKLSVALTVLEKRFGSTGLYATQGKRLSEAIASESKK